MGLFNYNNPFIVLMVRIANMMIVSFFWVLCCIPVVTIMPACAAMYHTVNRVIFGNGNGVIRDFFKTFKASLRPGILLSVILIIVGALVYFGIRVGQQIWNVGVFGAAYMAMGVLVAILCLSAVVYIAPALSRFEGNAGTIIRLSVYFSGRKLLRSIWYVILLVLAIWVVEFFPLILLVVPALYTDLIRRGVEKSMKKYIEDAGLIDAEEAEEELASQMQELSAREMDKLLSEDEQESGDE